MSEHETRERAAARRQLRDAGMMQAGAQLDSTDMIAAPPNGCAPRSVDEIMALARRMARVYAGTASEEDFAQARGEKWNEHPTLGEVFIGPMPNVGYDELARVSNLGRAESEAKIYLHRGVLRPRFEAEQIKELYPIIEGPATQELVAAIKRWNPTYHDRQDWVTACLGADRFTLMFLNCCINSGVWEKLTELFDDDPERNEARQATRLMFDRLLKYLPLYNSIMSIQEIAAALDPPIPLTMAAARAAWEAEERLRQGDFKGEVLPAVNGGDGSGSG